ncbi:MAG: membrane-bound PQQ-dependent dehydrogenase, glucose/quinate/shikimate family, partial [Pseudomonadota bacterium]|nr:membrane-bound PQQ-dependent dehydrogenase, glucose/quinate/shikimate family [Pseudomonadota bacterium]
MLFGTALLGGGTWLLALGGSLFYFLIGLAFLATGVLVFAGSALALWVYAGMVLASLLWSLWEVGFDWWQLAPRGGVIVVLGILLVLPPVVRSLDWKSHGLFRTGGWVALGVSLVTAFGVAGTALSVPVHELSGRLPEATVPAETIATAGVPPGEWHAYGRTPHGRRYSPLDQITPGNVANLEAVWTHHTGDIRGEGDPGETTYEVTPLKIGGTVYLCTPHHIVIALDAETGAEKWRFDPKIKQPDPDDTQHLTCRGVSFHDGARQPGAAAATPAAPAECAQRLFLPTVDARLIALSAATGQVCPGFGGEDGTVDLWQNMPNVKAG